MVKRSGSPTPDLWLEWMNEWMLEGTSAHKGHLVPYDMCKIMVLCYCSKTTTKL